MKEYSLLEIENLKLPEEGRNPRNRMRCILETITCIASEYAVGYLGYDVSDEILYPFIRKYFTGEIGAKDLLKRLLENYEIEDFFSILPGLDVSFNDSVWREALGKIFIKSGEKNAYRIGEKSFHTKKLFLNVSESEGLARAQRYYKEVGETKAFFLDIEDDSIITEISEPYRFVEVKTETKEETVLQISDEDFFDIEEIKSSDADQRKAIRAPLDKNLLVLAGAGSGKTRTLVSRLAYLHLVKSIPLSKIVLLTFTTSAADEMRSRAERLIVQIYQRKGLKKQPYVYAKTFDAFFRMLIVEYYGEIGFQTQPSLKLMADTGEKCTLLKEVIEENQLQRMFSEYISNRERLEILLMQMENYAKGLIVNELGLDRLLELFLDKQIEKNEVLDFLYANLLVKRALYRDGSLLKEIVMMRYSCFLIDEFQDISNLQNETLELFYDKALHFTFVGDDDQSIYAWRGADVSIIRDIINRKSTDTQYLLINYRNNPNIVKAGNCILRLISDRAKHKEIIPYKTSGAKICVSTNDLKFVNVVDEIDRLIKNGTDPKEISVLARKKKQAAGIEDALRSIGISVVSDMEPIKLDIYYNLFKALLNIWSDYDIYRSCQRILKYAKADRISEGDVKKIIRGEQETQGNLLVLQRIALDIFRPGADQISVIAERYAKKTGEEFAGLPDGNIVSEALDAFTDYLRDAESPWPISQKRLESAYAAFESARVFSNSNRKIENGVSVTTIHRAKGLEYNIVMIVGLDQGDYPDIKIIENTYNKKVQELESLKNARLEYQSLKNGITDITIRALVSDCNSSLLSEDEVKTMSPLKFVVEKKQRGLKNLSADAIEDYLEEYNASVVSIQRSYNFEQSKYSRKIQDLEMLLNQRKEQALLLDDVNEKITEAANEKIEILKEELQREKEKQEKAKQKQALFEKTITNLKNFYTTAFFASGLLEDMVKAEKIGVIKKQLEQEKQVRIEEERRTFYVAVTRARDQLYLFTDEGAVESEFVKDISDDLKTEFAVMTRNARKELERLAGGLRRELDKEIPDEQSIDSKIRSIISEPQFKEKLKKKCEEYLQIHPEYASLNDAAKRYFLQGMSLLFVGELTGMDFTTEFAHNMQKAAESLLSFTAGDCAIPFETSDSRLSNQIVSQIRKDAKSFNTQIPSRHFIESVISSDSQENRMDNLKKAAIQHYIVRSHQFMIKRAVYSTWKCQTLKTDPKDFLKASLGLSNMRNVLVHQNEDTWPEDPITPMLMYLKTIIAAGK